MLLLLLYTFIGIMIREITEEPDDHRADQNDSTHLLKVLTSLFPCMSEYGFSCRYTVRRKFHNEWQVVLLEECTHNLCSHNSKHDSKSIKSQKNQAGILREEGTRNKYIDRHSSCTRHQRNDEHRNQTALPVLNGSGCHYCRHIAAESHDHRNE